MMGDHSTLGALEQLSGCITSACLKSPSDVISALRPAVGAVALLLGSGDCRTLLEALDIAPIVVVGSVARMLARLCRAATVLSGALQPAASAPALGSSPTLDPTSLTLGLMRLVFAVLARVDPTVCSPERHVLVVAAPEDRRAILIGIAGVVDASFQALKRSLDAKGRPSVDSVLAVVQYACDAFSAAVRADALLLPLNERSLPALCSDACFSRVMYWLRVAGTQQAELALNELADISVSTASSPRALLAVMCAADVVDTSDDVWAVLSLSVPPLASILAVAVDRSFNQAAARTHEHVQNCNGHSKRVHYCLSPELVTQFVCELLSVRRAVDVLRASHMKPHGAGRDLVEVIASAVRQGFGARSEHVGPLIAAVCRAFCGCDDLRHVIVTAVNTVMERLPHSLSPGAVSSWFNAPSAALSSGVALVRSALSTSFLSFKLAVSVANHFASVINATVRSTQAPVVAHQPTVQRRPTLLLTAPRASVTLLVGMVAALNELLSFRGTGSVDDSVSVFDMDGALALRDSAVLIAFIATDCANTRASANPSHAQRADVLSYSTLACAALALVRALRRRVPEHIGICTQLTDATDTVDSIQKLIPAAPLVRQSTTDVDPARLVPVRHALITHIAQTTATPCVYIFECQRWYSPYFFPASPAERYIHAENGDYYFGRDDEAVEAAAWRYQDEGGWGDLLERKAGVGPQAGKPFQRWYPDHQKDSHARFDPPRYLQSLDAVSETEQVTVPGFGVSWTWADDWMVVKEAPLGSTQTLQGGGWEYALDWESSPLGLGFDPSRQRVTDDATNRRVRRRLWRRQISVVDNVPTPLCGGALGSLALPVVRTPPVLIDHAFPVGDGVHPRLIELMWGQGRSWPIITLSDISLPSPHVLSLLLQPLWLDAIADELALGAVTSSYVDVLCKSLLCGRVDTAQTHLDILRAEEPAFVCEEPTSSLIALCWLCRIVVESSFDVGGRQRNRLLEILTLSSHLATIALSRLPTAAILSATDDGVSRLMRVSRVISAATSLSHSSSADSIERTAASSLVGLLAELCRSRHFSVTWDNDLASLRLPTSTCDLSTLRLVNAMLLQRPLIDSGMRISNILVDGIRAAALRPGAHHDAPQLAAWTVCGLWSSWFSTPQASTEERAQLGISRNVTAKWPLADVVDELWSKGSSAIAYAAADAAAALSPDMLAASQSRNRIAAVIAVAGPALALLSGVASFDAGIARAPPAATASLRATSRDWRLLQRSISSIHTAVVSTLPCQQRTRAIISAVHGTPTCPCLLPNAERNDILLWLWAMSRCAALLPANPVAPVFLGTAHVPSGRRLVQCLGPDLESGALPLRIQCGAVPLLLQSIDSATRGLSTTLHRDAATAALRRAQDAVDACARVTQADPEADLIAASDAFDVGADCGATGAFPALVRSRNELAALEDGLAKQRCTVLACGTVNAGKSSLLNALLDFVRVPTCIRLPSTPLVGTSHLVELKFSPQVKNDKREPFARLQLDRDVMQQLSVDSIRTARNDLILCYENDIAEKRARGLSALADERQARLASITHFYDALNARITGCESVATASSGLPPPLRPTLSAGVSIDTTGSASHAGIVECGSYDIPSNSVGHVPLEHFVLADFAMPATNAEPLYQRVIQDVYVTVPLGDGVDLPVSYSLVDSPGINGVCLAGAHRQRSYFGIDRASVCLAVIDASNMQTSEVWHLIDELHNRRKDVVIALNKVDCWGRVSAAERQAGEHLAMAEFSPRSTTFTNADGVIVPAVLFVSAELSKHAARVHALQPGQVGAESLFSDARHAAEVELRSLAGICDPRSDAEALAFCRRMVHDGAWSSKDNREALAAILRKLSRVGELWSAINAVISSQQSKSADTRNVIGRATCVLNRVLSTLVDPLLAYAEPADVHAGVAVTSVTAEISARFASASAGLNNAIRDFSDAVMNCNTTALRAFDNETLRIETLASRACTAGAIADTDANEIINAPESLRLVTEAALVASVDKLVELRCDYRLRIERALEDLMTLLSVTLDATRGPVSRRAQSFDVFALEPIQGRPSVMAEFAAAVASVDWTNVIGAVASIVAGAVIVANSGVIAPPIRQVGATYVFGGLQRLVSAFSAASPTRKMEAIRHFEQFSKDAQCKRLRNLLQSAVSREVHSAMLSFSSWSRDQLDSLLTARALSATASGLIDRIHVPPSVARELRESRDLMLRCMYELAVINEIEAALFYLSVNGAIRLREGSTLQDCGAADLAAAETMLSLRGLSMGSICIPTPVSIAGETASFGEQIYHQLVTDRRALLDAMPAVRVQPPVQAATEDVSGREFANVSQAVSLSSHLGVDVILKSACAALAAAAVYAVPRLESPRVVDLPLSVLSVLDSAGLEATVLALHFTPQRPPENLVQWGVYEVSLSHRGVTTRLFSLSCIAFRGTKSWDDVIVDASFVPSVAADGLRLHSGFASTLLPMLPSVNATLAELIGTKQAPTVITGHSLGGAYAQIFALLSERANSVEVMTFGAPLVWAPDRQTAQGGESRAPSRLHPRVEALAQRLHCIVHGADIVPRLLGNTSLTFVSDLLSMVNESLALRLRSAADVAEQYAWIGSVYRLDMSRSSLRYEFVGCSGTSASVAASVEAVQNFLSPLPSINSVNHHSISDFYAPLMIRAVAAKFAMRA